MNYPSHMFEYSPSSGEIDTELPDYEKLLVINFKTNGSEEVSITKTDLSKHQQYLLNIVQAVPSGECLLDLCVKDPQPHSHFQWLTWVNHLHHENTAAVCFNISMCHSVKFGPKCIFKAVQTSSPKVY